MVVHGSGTRGVYGVLCDLRKQLERLKGEVDRVISILDVG